MKKIILALCIGLAATCASAGDFKGHHNSKLASVSKTSYQASHTQTVNGFDQIQFSISVSNVKQQQPSYKDNRHHASWKPKGKQHRPSHRAHSRHNLHKAHWR